MGILTGYTVGPNGEDFGRLSEQERIDTATEQLGEIYDDPEGEFNAGASLAWQDEEYTGGTYSAWSPGQVTKFWDVVRRPEGSIFWAGEHTADFVAYMEGALRSGLRAAREIDSRS